MKAEHARACVALANLADIVASRPGVSDPASYRHIADQLRQAVRSGHPLASPLAARDNLTMNEAADIARVNVRTLRRHIADGSLPTTTVGRRRTVRAVDLAAWLDARKATR